MSKGKILSLVTVSGMLLLLGGSLVQADVITGGSDTIMVSGVGTGVTDPTTPPLLSTDPSTQTPSTDPITDITDPRKPTPSTDPITDITDPSIPTPSTDPITDTTDPSIPTPSTDPIIDTTDPSTPIPNTDSSTPTTSTYPNTPSSKPISKPIIDNPISTVTGDSVVGTDNGKDIVKEGNGTVLKDAKEVGGEVQKDGTVVVKKSDGGLEVLPHTGESKTIITIAGILSIAGAIWISIRGNKKNITIYKKLNSTKKFHD